MHSNPLYHTITLSLLIISSLSPSQAQSTNFIARDVTSGNAEATYAQLQQWYDQSTGLWQHTWWNSGSCTSTIINLASVDNNVKKNIISVVENTFAQAPKTYPGFVSPYYDDDSWWALAWIAAYDLTSNPTYLSTAQTLFTTINSTFTQTPCSSLNGVYGGIWWDDAHTYINAIANELYLSVAAHLANRVSDSNQRAAYTSLAKQQWAWFKAAGFINSGGTINDGLDSSCRNNLSTVVWTYNQGVILGGLVELHTADSGNGEYLSSAQSIANAALSQLTTNDILHEACESYPQGCDADRTQFKGIFVRNLVKLAQATGNQQYASFIETNAESVWGKDNNGQGVLGVDWDGPYMAGNASTTCSGLDVLVAALQV